MRLSEQTRALARNRTGTGGVEAARAIHGTMAVLKGKEGLRARRRVVGVRIPVSLVVRLHAVGMHAYAHVPRRR